MEEEERREELKVDKILSVLSLGDDHSYRLEVKPLLPGSSSSNSIKGFTLFNQRGGKAGNNSPESDQINEELPLSENSRKLSESMSAFFKKAEEQLIKVHSQQSAALSMVKEITEYFHGNSVKEEARPFRIFMVVRDFLSNLDQVCKEVRRINERTKVSSACQFQAPICTSLPPLFPELSGSQTYSTSDDESSFSS
ncbi:hypothetical protein ACET3Z_024911 [Daucus carota]